MLHERLNECKDEKNKIKINKYNIVKNGENVNLKTFVV